MLLPKITTRQLFMLIAVVAVYSSIAASAARGNMVAYAIGASLASLVIPCLVYSLVYWALFYYASRQTPTTHAPPIDVDPAISMENSQESS